MLPDDVASLAMYLEHTFLTNKDEEDEDALLRTMKIQQRYIDANAEEIRGILGEHSNIERHLQTLTASLSALRSESQDAAQEDRES